MVVMSTRARRRPTPRWPRASPRAWRSALGACTSEPRTGSRPARVGHRAASGPAVAEQAARARGGVGSGTRAELDDATRQVARLARPSWPGQVIVARWSGTGPPTRLVRDLHLGGVIAFSENVTSAAQLRETTRSLQRSSRRPWPLLVGVDQEGGLVERVQGDATGFPAFMAAGAADRPALTRRAYAASGRGAAVDGPQRRLRARRRRHHRPRGPRHRLPLGRQRPPAGGRAGARRSPGFPPGRRGAGAQALPRARLGHHRQPRRAPGPGPHPRRAGADRPGALHRGGRRRPAGRHGRPHRRAGRRPGGAGHAVAPRHGRLAAW